MSTLTLHAPAKLNLYLKVLGRRADGFHLLDSLFHTIGLCDTLRLTPADAIGLSCSDPTLNGPDNLALRAAEMLNEASGGGHGAHIGLDKRIPTGAGLGGGSSDAATALIGLNRLWGLGWDRSRLAALGEKLGSDVPFFIYGGMARVAGRGEVVCPLNTPVDAWCVLIYPGCHVDTGRIFRRLGMESGAGLLTVRASDSIITPVQVSAQGACPVSSNDARWAKLGNDLESVAREVAPEIGAALDALGRSGGSRARMSGSGSAVFCLTPDEASAQAIKNRLIDLEAWPDIWPDARKNAWADGWNVWVVPLVPATDGDDHVGLDG